MAPPHCEGPGNHDHGCPDMPPLRRRDSVRGAVLRVLRSTRGVSRAQPPLVPAAHSAAPSRSGVPPRHRDGSLGHSRSALHPCQTALRTMAHAEPSAPHPAAPPPAASKTYPDMARSHRHQEPTESGLQVSGPLTIHPAGPIGKHAAGHPSRRRPLAEARRPQGADLQPLIKSARTIAAPRSGPTPLPNGPRRLYTLYFS